MYDKAMLMTELVRIAEEAGREIMVIYRDESRWQVQKKEDQSPLTAADIAANKVIVKQLAALTPDIPIISEECDEIPFTTRKQWSQCWLVDPLDGTKEFIARTDEFSINIALVENHRATLGIIHSPVTKKSYVAAKNYGAYLSENNQRSRLSVREFSENDLRIVTSRRHRGRRDEAFLKKAQQLFGAIDVAPAGSAFKICKIAEGSADVYPRFGHTMEWDTAAGQIIVEEAGGALVDIKGRPFRYNQRETLLNNSFLVLGGHSEKWLPIWQYAEQQ